MVLSPHGGMVYTRNLKFLAVRLTGSSPVGDTIMQNEHIEYFKRYSSCYLMWVNSNFDRIVFDILKQDAITEIKRKNEIRINLLMSRMPQYKPVADFVFDFDRDVLFGVKILK